MPNYVDYYHLERYLFETVSPRFCSVKSLNAFDFFCIVIWKANRAKSKIAARLLSHGHKTIDGAVQSLLSEVSSTESPSAKLSVLVNGWGFRLPMASAILTVLYPDVFTVYDVRVCDVISDFHALNGIVNPERLWDGYARYCKAVEAAAPLGLSLRDKDRWLWGKSFATQLQDSIASKFSRASSVVETAV